MQNLTLHQHNDLNIRFKKSIQKVGYVKYNPFSNVGGELSFALAMLDEEKNGFIVNTIFHENGNYTYWKPVNDGITKEKLSDEEKQALNKALCLN